MVLALSESEVPLTQLVKAKAPARAPAALSAWVAYLLVAQKRAGALAALRSR